MTEQKAPWSERLWRNPPLFALVLLGLGWWAHVGFGNPWPLPWLWLNSVATGLFLLAGILAVWAFVCFYRSRTGWEPTDKPCFLIAYGPFKFSRNPAYLALLLLLIGAAFWMLDPLVLAAPLLYFLGMNTTQISYEERRLRQQFGSAYDDYCRKTRRWI
ncbi:isoprenylcysteine carboxylmethyltransferase family protein [candidate division KSB1 bacterium]|nr:MAG: isoprenylcysteine carboxylmethyltransferase family protein [candidate division KSB1 bacterium]